MDRVDAIYQRHVAALERIGACGDAVRLSLRLALEELEEGARSEGRGAPSLEDRTAAFHQMTRIGAWLAKHAGGQGEGMEIADAMIAFAESKLQAIQGLTLQITTKHNEMVRAQEAATLAQGELYKLRQEMALAEAIPRGTNGSHANPPYVLPEEAVKVLRADDVDAIRGSTWLRDDDREWLEGLERGAHSFRTVPKETRRRLVQAHIDAVRTDSEAPRQFDFDQSRPVWMPTAGSAAATFGISWADLCAAKDMPY